MNELTDSSISKSYIIIYDSCLFSMYMQKIDEISSIQCLGTKGILKSLHNIKFLDYKLP